MTADLFPDTLLVHRENDRVYTTSLKVAEHFKRQHKHLLRAIRNILNETADEAWRRDFAAQDYRDERGKTRPLYVLTHDGFAIAVMGLTGPAARAWKRQFLAAFREMDRELEHTRHAIQAREAQPPPAPQARARLAALRPTLEARYRWLNALLSDAANGLELTDWDLDLALADLDAVLALMRGPGPGGADATEVAP
jgi:Rha family phage regulatory protein